MNEVRVWAPATVANLNVGFDGLGAALATPGERLIARKTDLPGSVRIRAIHGAPGLSLDAEENVAGVAAQSLLNALGAPCGIELEIHKDVLPGSGIGSSAASAAAAVVAVDALLNGGLRADELLPFALDGEALASGSRHADNVAPALMGGIVLCPPEGAPVRIPVPDGWHLTIVHPQVEIRTAEARNVLPTHVPLVDAVNQARWFAAFVAACHRNDGVAAAYALEDLFIGPARAPLIPCYPSVARAAAEAGARAGGISGSGPSTFWLSFSIDDAQTIGESAAAILAEAGIPTHIHVTHIASRGAHVL
jgi:homoserine kinase